MLKVGSRGRLDAGWMPPLRRRGLSPFEFSFDLAAAARAAGVHVKRQNAPRRGIFARPFALVTEPKAVEPNTQEAFAPDTKKFSLR